MPTQDEELHLRREECCVQMKETCRCCHEHIPTLPQYTHCQTKLTSWQDSCRISARTHLEPATCLLTRTHLCWAGIKGLRHTKAGGMDMLFASESAQEHRSGTFLTQSGIVQCCWQNKNGGHWRDPSKSWLKGPPQAITVYMGQQMRGTHKLLISWNTQPLAIYALLLLSS